MPTVPPVSGQGLPVDGRTLRFQHRRPELLAAAAEYVMDHGVAELSLRPLANDLGVTHATLLRHFETKEALVTEVVAHIRQTIGRQPSAPAVNLARASTAQLMRTVWGQLCLPAARRQFALLFEVVAMEARQPGRFEGLEQALVTDFLAPLEARFRRDGKSKAAARDIATAYLAQVRGLQLDLALTGDQRRVDAAMNRYIDFVTSD